MDYQEILQELKNPEKEIIELKQSFSEWEDIARTIAAFSTKRGGKIFVGVDRAGCPIGTLCNNNIKGRLHSLANNEIKPSASICIEITNHDQKKELFIVCIIVQKGNGIFSFKGINYERRGETNHQLTADEIFELQKTIKKLYFDELPAFSIERPALITDIDEKKINEFLFETKQISEVVDIKRFLSNHSLLVNGSLQVKNAAIMLFGKNPEMFLPHNKISICVFPSNIVTPEFAKKEIIGDVIYIYKQTSIELQRNIKIHSFIDGMKRIDVPEYPLEAIRETLINSIVHRDYFDRNTEIFIKVFLDRIEILNPASFPFENITFEEIKKSGLSKRRNPIVATFFETMKFMEQEGRGLTRMSEAMKIHGLPPPIIEVGEKTFKVILKNSSQNPDAIKKSPYGNVADFNALNDRQLKIIKYLQTHDNAPISRNDYQNITYTSSEKTASRDLDDLYKRKILDKIGERRWTRYFLT